MKLKRLTLHPLLCKDLTLDKFGGNHSVLGWGGSLTGKNLVVTDGENMTRRESNFGLQQGLRIGLALAKSCAKPSCPMALPA